MKLVLASNEEGQELLGYLQENAWLLQHLPKLPHFSAMRPQVVAALRQACQVTCASLFYLFFLILRLLPARKGVFLKKVVQQLRDFHFVKFITGIIIAVDYKCP